MGIVGIRQSKGIYMGIVGIRQSSHTKEQRPNTNGKRPHQTALLTSVMKHVKQEEEAKNIPIQQLRKYTTNTTAIRLQADFNLHVAHQGRVTNQMEALSKHPFQECSPFLSFGLTTRPRTPVFVPCVCVADTALQMPLPPHACTRQRLQRQLLIRREIYTACHFFAGITNWVHTDHTLVPHTHEYTHILHIHIYHDKTPPPTLSTTFLDCRQGLPFLS